MHWLPHNEFVTVAPTPVKVRARPLWDVVLTIVLDLVYLILTLLGSVFGAFLAFASDSCGSSTVCNDDQISAGWVVATLVVWAPVIFVIGISILLLVLKRRAFWMPILGIVLTIAIEAIGFTLAVTAVAPTQ